MLELQANGIDVAYFTTTENEQTEYLKNQGLFIGLFQNYRYAPVSLIKRPSGMVVLMFIGYSTEEDSIIKISDTKLANDY